MCPADLYVKSRVVQDTLKLAKKKSLDQVEIFESLTKIYPATETSGLSSTVLDLMKVFYGLTKIRDKEKLTS